MSLYAQLLQWNGQLTAWKSFTVTAPAGQLPTLSVRSDPGASRTDQIALSNLVIITDPDSVGYQKLELWESGGSGGGRAVRGQARPRPAAMKSTLLRQPGDSAFNVGTLGGTDTLWAQLLQANGQLTGWEPFTVSAPAARLPTLSVHSSPARPAAPASRCPHW